MPTVDALLDADATEVAAAVSRGEVTAGEVLEEALRRIDERNGVLNAVVARDDEAARAAASSVTGGPLAGVPFVVKDLGVDVAGLPGSGGSRLFAGVVPASDSEIVARYRRAGAVIVRLTNSPELGKNASTEPLLFGATRNPYDLGRSPGGSSGGTAAAVASGMVPAGHGNDGGGSIRIPASCCGLVGLKPSRARTPAVPRRQAFAYPLAVNHALTRTVRDTALLLDVASGPSPIDSVLVPEPERPYVEEVGRDPGRLRVAVSTSTPTGDAVHPACAEAAEEAGRLLESLGHHVVQDTPRHPVDALTTVMRVVMSVPLVADVEARLAQLGRPLADDDLEPFTRVLYESGRSVTGAQYVQALREMERAAEEIGPFFTGYDLLVTPTIAEPPPPLGHLDTTDVAAMAKRAGRYSTMTMPFNVTGQPAISLPLGSHEGLPIGVQLVAAMGREDLLIRVAAQVEAAAPWPTAPVWPPRT